MSEEEKRHAARAGVAHERLWVVPNGVDVERFQPFPESQKPLELLFVGSFRHLPNILGFQFLIEQILPPLWSAHPELRVRVVAGPDYEKHLHHGGHAPRIDPRIQIDGFVADIVPHYVGAHVVVVPLTVSAGTNIKVFEALACGRPVVSTSVGCAGLGLARDEEILIADDAERFRAALKRLIEQPDLRRTLGERGRRAAVERFSWEGSAECAEAMYEAVLARVDRSN